MKAFLSDLRFVLRGREEGHCVLVRWLVVDMRSLTVLPLSKRFLQLTRSYPIINAQLSHAGSYIAYSLGSQTHSDPIQIYTKYHQIAFYLRISLYPAFPNSLSHAAFLAVFSGGLPLTASLPPQPTSPSHFSSSLANPQRTPSPHYPSHG